MKAICNITKITPEQASELLQVKFGGQRQVRKGHVERLASDMRAGRFMLGPDAILLVKGTLANGQHRLEALVASGKPQWFIVMESDDDELYKVIDAGIKRSVIDGLNGVKFAKSLPSVARWVMQYNAGLSAKFAQSATARVEGSTASQVYVINFCQANQDALIESVGFVQPLYQKSNVMPESIGAAVHYIGRMVNEREKTEAFLSQVYHSEGAPTVATDLHNRLVANRGSSSRMPAGYMFGLVLKSLKHYLAGNRVGVLKWGKDESLPVLP